MKKTIALFVLLFAITLSAQDKLEFNKRYVQSEDKWVTYPADSTGSYTFGFIYIDPTAGLTFDYGGSFKIDNTGKFVLKNTIKDTSIKSRLQPNNRLIAFIPESKFKELNIEKTPDWLHFYKEGEGTVERLYKWGFTYNGWEECEKALEFLEKAQKINPDYNGLRVELAFSYNCLKQYQKAADILKIALKAEPLDAYINKELIYSTAKSGQVEEAANLCRKVFSECPDKKYNPENAYQVLQQYYLAKDVKNFNIWLKETKSYLFSDERFKKFALGMEKELNQ